MKESINNSGNRIEDVEIAHEMANASNNLRTMEAEKRGSAHSKRLQPAQGIVDRAKDFLSGFSPESKEALRIGYENAAADYADDAEMVEIPIEVDVAVKKETASLNISQINALIHSAIDNIKITGAELDNFSKEINKLDEKEKYQQRARLSELKANSWRAWYRLDALVKIGDTRIQNGELLDEGQFETITKTYFN